MGHNWNRVYSKRRTIKVPIYKIKIISNNRIYKMFHIRSHRTMLCPAYDISELVFFHICWYILTDEIKFCSTAFLILIKMFVDRFTLVCKLEMLRWIENTFPITTVSIQCFLRRPCQFVPAHFKCFDCNKWNWRKMYISNLAS